MKNKHLLRTRLEPSGFALVVTLSLMILLTIVAVGLLSLSAISLRTTSQGEAMATARSNARMALMLALGDLQKSLGPDRAVSATSGILSASSAKPNTTGVWESWDYKPDQANLDYTGAKDSRFRGWLVSSATPSDALKKSFVETAWPAEGNSTAVLVGKNAMGGSEDQNSWSKAGKVPVSRILGKVDGAYAWHVSDESVKARINLYRDPGESNAPLARKRALLAGHRPMASMINNGTQAPLDFLPKDLNGVDFKKAQAESPKVTGIEQVGLIDHPGNAPEKIRPFRNDVTPYSLGVMSDVRGGGLKQDLSSIFEMTTTATDAVLPTEFKDRRLYQSTHGITGVSDPFWSNLAGYYNTFRGIATPDSLPTFNSRPTQHISLADKNSENPQKSFSPGPVIAKVEALFTYVTRDSHGPWREAATGFKYMGHLVFTPLVTLHNPYNVNISFERMVVKIRNVPIAFRMYVNDVPQSSQLVSLTDMFVNEGQRKEVQFVLEIANWSGPGSGSVTGPVVLRPGQTLVSGPYFDPAVSFGNGTGPFFNYRNDLTGTDTNPMKCRPGFYGRSIGFDIDWLTPTHGGLSSGQQNDSNRGVFLYHATDRVYFEHAVRRPTFGLNTSFEVTAKLIDSRGTYYDYGGLQFDYQDERTLGRLFPEIHRYPSRGHFDQRTSYVENIEPLANHARAQTFGVFSAYARTAGGGVFANNSRQPGGGALRDGRVAGMPFLHHNPARTVVKINYSSEKPGAHSHELNYQPFAVLGEVEDYFFLDPTNRNNYLLGNTSQRGIKSGSYLELPTGPMLTIADFRRSNALSSFYLPNFVQPVANSVVSPLMATDKVKSTDSAVASYELLDHSTLANHALYDRFYFSTFATNGTNTPDRVFDNFMAESAPLLSQAFTPYLPAGKTASKAKAELFSGNKPTDTAYKTAAEYQMIRGPFNVNSTSVQAWRAMLSTLKGSDIWSLWATNSTLKKHESTNTPILPMSLVNGGRIGGPVSSAEIDNPKTNDWNGYSEITPAQLDELALKIVEQVRLRGPFLSMSEFVNRRIGQTSNLTESGALETAIKESKLNDNFLKDSVVPIALGDIGNTSIYPFKTPSASVGNPAAGAPGWISQGDLMRLLEPAATVRSDTFVVRVSGEARDSTGKITAIAYAEAIVQRMPDYVDLADRPSLNAYNDATAAPVNKLFGRRMSVVSFRWLSSNEV